MCQIILNDLPSLLISHQSKYQSVAIIFSSLKAIHPIHSCDGLKVEGMNEWAVGVELLNNWRWSEEHETEPIILDSNMHPQLYGNHAEDGPAASFALNGAVTTNSTAGQDGSTIESNHSSPVWPIPSTSSSAITLPVNTGNGSHPLANADLFSPEPYSVAAMAVSRYADDVYMNCYSTKMNSLLLAHAATNKLNDPTSTYNRKWQISSPSSLPNTTTTFLFQLTATPSMNHVNVSIAAQQHRRRTHAGVKTGVDSIFAINVAFTPRVKCHRMQRCTAQQRATPIDPFEKRWASTRRRQRADRAIEGVSRALCIVPATNAPTAAPRIPLCGDEMPVERVSAMLVVSITNCTEYVTIRVVRRGWNEGWFCSS